MKIAIFTETFLPKLDGMVTVTCLLLEHLRRIHAEVMVFVPGSPVTEYAGFPIVGLGGLPAPMYPELSLAVPMNQTYQTLRAFNPDVIHVMNPVVAGVRGVQFAKRLNKPLMVTFHTHLMEMARFYGFGMFEGVLWQLHRMVYQQADCVMATSQHAQHDLIQHGFGDVGLWRRGVDTSRFSPEHATHAMRQRLLGGNPDATLLLSAGRLAPEKQVEQIREVLDAVPNVHLAIVGDGPHRKALEAHYKNYPVTFLGYMAGRELSEAYASADLFVFPSSSIETFGLVAVEAMASGLPIVASRVGGIPELIRDGINGFSFRENDTATLVQHVHHLVAHPETWDRLGWNARQTVARLDWGVIMDEFFEVYHSLIARDKARARSVAQSI